MSDETTCKVHQALARALADHGVETLFGLMGDGNLFMVDSFVREHGGRFVPASHEGNGVLMAHGFAQAHRTVGVATVTHGPGLTNTVTALGEAARCHTPLVLLCGDTPADNPNHPQTVDQRALVATTGAGFHQMRTPATALEDLAMAFVRAASEERPIVFNMPIEFQWADITYRRTVYQAPDRRAYIPASDDLDRAVGIIATARRPIVLAGRGAIDAREALVALAERIDAPLATTLRGKSLFAGEAFNLGIFGNLSTEIAAEEIMRSDCVIAFGASLNAHTQGGGNRQRGGLLDGKRVIQVELDASRIDRNFHPTVSVVGDAALTARRFLELLNEAGLPGSGYRSPELARAIADYRPTPHVTGVPGKQAPGTIDIRQALLRLDGAIPADRTLVTDVGRFIINTWKLFSVPSPTAFVHAAAFTAIGTGIGTAIGAAIDTGRPTVLVCGDGGLMMSGLSELNTVAQENLDLVVIVCNDQCYGAEHMQFHARDMDTGMSRLNQPAFARVAASFGFETATVQDEASLEAAAELVRNRKGPVLVDLHLDADRISIT